MTHAGKKLQEFVTDLIEEKKRITGKNYSLTELSKDIGLSEDHRKFHYLFKKEGFSTYELSFFYLVFGIKPTEFGEKSDKLLNSGFNSSHKTNHSMDVVFCQKYKMEYKQSIATKLKPESYYSKFFKECFNRISEYLKDTKQSIIVLDYLADKKGISEKLGYEKHKNDQYSYHNYHRNYLEEIYRLKLENKGIEYHRILQLPYFPNFQNNKLFQCINTTIDRAIEMPLLKSKEQSAHILMALMLLFPESLEHIAKMFSLPSQESKFRLSVLPNPIRLHSFLIADDKILISEYDRYNKEGIALPDLVFIDKSIEGPAKIENTSNQVIYGYLDQIKELEKSLIDIDRYTFSHCILILKDYWSRHSEEIEDKLTNLENIISS